MRGQTVTFDGRGDDRFEIFVIGFLIEELHAIIADLEFKLNGIAEHLP